MNNNYDELLKSGNAQDYIEKNLSDEQKKKLENVLSDKQALKEILSSPAALELIKKLKNK